MVGIIDCYDTEFFTGILSVSMRMQACYVETGDNRISLNVSVLPVCGHFTPHCKVHNLYS
jgi:hypothetical protein